MKGILRDASITPIETKGNLRKRLETEEQICYTHDWLFILQDRKVNHEPVLRRLSTSTQDLAARFLLLQSGLGI